MPPVEIEYHLRDFTHSSGITNSFFGSRRKPTKTRAFTFSGTTVYYGYDAALARMQMSAIQISKPQHVIKDQATDLTSTSGVAVDVHLPTTASEDGAEFLKSHIDKDKEPSHTGEEGVKRVTDLVLIVHGIGQGVRIILYPVRLPHVVLFQLASQYEGWSFLYAVNHFRQLAKCDSLSSCYEYDFIITLCQETSYVTGSCLHFA